MTVEVSKQTLNEVYEHVVAIEKSDRVKSAVIVVLSVGLLIAVSVVVFLSLALQSRSAAVDRNQTVGECRDDAFAVWADDVVGVLDDEITVSDIRSLEAAYDACGRR